MNNERLSKRNSNIEILRGIAMLFIIYHHYATYGIMRTGASFYDLWKEGSLFNKVLACMLIPGGEIGVAIFFIISGYFLCKSKKIRDISKIIESVFYYSAIIIITYIAIRVAGYSYPDLSEITQIRIILKLFFIPASSGHWWFITSYLLLMILVPTINQFLDSYKFQGKLRIIAFIWLFYYIIASYDTPFFYLYKAVFFYSIGAAIHEYISEKCKNGGGGTRKDIRCIFIALFFILWSLFAGGEYIIGSIMSSLSDTIRIKIICEIIELLRSGLFVPIAAISITLSFVLMESKQSELINSITNSTMGIYLLHGGTLSNTIIWNYFIDVRSHFLSNWFFALSSFTCIAIFIIGVFVDKIREYYIEDKFGKTVISLIDSFNRKYSCSNNDINN